MKVTPFLLWQVYNLLLFVVAVVLITSSTSVSRRSGLLLMTIAMLSFATSLMYTFTIGKKSFMFSSSKEYYGD